MSFAATSGELSRDNLPDKPHEQRAPADTAGALLVNQARYPLSCFGRRTPGFTAYRTWSACAMCLARPPMAGRRKGVQDGPRLEP